MQNDDFARVVRQTGNYTAYIVCTVRLSDVFRAFVIRSDRGARHALPFDAHRDSATDGSQPACKLIRTIEGRQLATRDRERFLRRVFCQVMVRKAAISDPHRHPVVTAVQRAETADVAVAGGGHQFRVG